MGRFQPGSKSGRFQDRQLFFQIGCTTSDTDPTDAMNRKRVHMNGNLDIFQEGSLRIVWAV